MIDLIKYFAGTKLALLLIIFAPLAAQGRFMWLALATVVVGMGGCLLTMHNHPHYLANALPYVGLLIGLGTLRLRQLGPGFPWFSAAALGIILVPAAYQRTRIVAAEPTYLAMEHVAAEVDRLAPPEATLWVCGPIPSEAIQFASRLPAANTHPWVFPMRSPWKQLLPKPWETIVREYQEHPPAALVVHRGLLQEATAAPPGDSAPEYLQLLRLLLNEQQYKVVAEVEGYDILVRER